MKIRSEATLTLRAMLARILLFNNRIGAFLIPFEFAFIFSIPAKPEKINFSELYRPFLLSVGQSHWAFCNITAVFFFLHLCFSPILTIFKINALQL